MTTWSYDWKTRGVSSVLYERNTTGGDDITVSYTYDDNGQALQVTDGRSYVWGKSWDAMLRMSSISMPSGGAAPLYVTIYDGNSNIIKTVDFKSVTHYYFYDVLNRMIEHGPNATVTTNTEKYTWTCCARMTAYVDAQGTASLSYDDLGRLESHTDSNGNTVAYEYDEMSRVSRIKPANLELAPRRRRRNFFALAGALASSNRRCQLAESA